MSSPKSVQTWTVLKALGFVGDSSVIHSDRQPGLSLMLGRHKIEASELLNRWFAPIVRISGVVAAPRTVIQVAGEIAREVESVEQGMAFLAFILKDAMDNIDPSQIPSWLTEGRCHAHLLPWERENAAYQARPHCYVERDWMRLGLRALADTLAELDDQQPVVLSFDAGALTISCAGKAIPMPATGAPWPERFVLTAGQLRDMPHRLMRPSIEVSIWESRLRIGNRQCTELITTQYSL